MSENRFKNVRETYSEEKRDSNPHERIYSVNRMVEDFNNEYNFHISESKIKKIESDTPGATISADILIAYSKKFNVSTDYLLGLTNSKELNKPNLRSACDFTGLSSDSIRRIHNINSEEKSILDKLISKYNLLCCLADIKQLLAYYALSPEVYVTFKERAYSNAGHPIDKELEDTINNEYIRDFFNQKAINSFTDIVANIVNDDSLKQYFYNLYKSSKIKTILTAEDLSILGNLEEGENNEVT